MAQGKLEEASEALSTCLSTKKVIQAKIDAVEKARAAAQKGLDACLATKARLKSALDECHTRRDSAREKLKACLDRKVVLKQRIKECHEKRDEARKKLDECLAKKKELKAKIVSAKKKMMKRSSLLELQQQEFEEGQALEDLLGMVRGLNFDFDSGARDLKEVGNEMKRIVDSMRASSKEEADLEAELATIEQDSQGKVQRDNDEMLKSMQDTWDSVKQMDFA